MGRHDIALLHLNETLDAKDKSYKYETLPMCRKRLPRVEELVFGSCGLGVTDILAGTSTSPQELKEYFLKELVVEPCDRSVEPESCQDLCSFANPDEKICTTDLKEFEIESACHGDSGGPMYVFGAGVVPACVYGITSHGDSQDQVACYGRTVFTRVAQYAYWVVNTVAHNGGW